jgi:hypothetical protein
MRRAFDVAAPSQDERWDIEQTPVVHVEPQRSLAEKAAEKRASIPAPDMNADRADPYAGYVVEDDPKRFTDAEVDADATPEPVAAPEPPTDATVCGAVAQDGLMAGEVCSREPHDKGAHKNANGSWPLS